MQTIDTYYVDHLVNLILYLYINIYISFRLIYQPLVTVELVRVLTYLCNMYV